MINVATSEIGIITGHMQFVVVYVLYDVKYIGFRDLSLKKENILFLESPAKIRITIIEIVDLLLNF